MENTKNIKAVEWVRAIRDNNSTKYKTEDMGEFARKLSDEAKKSQLWMRLKKRSSQTNTTK